MKSSSEQHADKKPRKRVSCAQTDCIPKEVWEHVVLFLSVGDVMSLLSVNKHLYHELGESSSFWEMLSIRDGSSCDGAHPETEGTKTTERAIRNRMCSWRDAKDSYLLRCNIADPTKAGAGVKWYPVCPYGPFSGISDREGHISCVLSRRSLPSETISEMESSPSNVLSKPEAPIATAQDRIVVITGGFTDDDSVYLINAGTGKIKTDSYIADNSGSKPHRWGMRRVEPTRGKGPSFVYGATLTALPTEYSESNQGKHPPTLKARMRAIRFGGFRAGGYSNETSQVSMLTITQKARARRCQRRGNREHDRKNDSDEQDSPSMWEWIWDPEVEVDWSNIATMGSSPGNDDDENSPERDFLSRAYHTSTLLLGRYLVVIGGMKSMGSVLNEAVLDTKTWTWIGDGELICATGGMANRPSGRHGHSVVLDNSRNRLVLFGGGSGSDLLRSGQDNSEVWELQLGEKWRFDDQFTESFPWKWNKLHNDSVQRNNGNDDSAYGNIEERPESSTNHRTNARLSPSETLSLGRCHNGIKVSRDRVLLCFGSGRPSTNGLLAYDLGTDTFLRKEQTLQYPPSLSNGGPVYIKGILPKPRFTGIATYLEEDGYILTHGGYCSQDHDTLGTMDVLDLAPGFRGRPGHPISFDGLAVDERRVSYGEVTDMQAERGRQDPDAALQRMLQTIVDTPRSDRQSTARAFLNQMEMDVLPSNSQSLLLISMIVDGTPLLVGDEDQDD